MLCGGRAHKLTHAPPPPLRVNLCTPPTEQSAPAPVRMPYSWRDIYFSRRSLVGFARCPQLRLYVRLRTWFPYPASHQLGGCNSLSFLLLTPVSRFSFLVEVAAVLRVVREPACKRRELCVVLFCQSNYTLYTTLLVHCGFRAGSSRPIHSHSTLSLLSSVLWVSLRICIFQ